MTSTKTQQSDQKPAATRSELAAWDMMTSILAGLYKASGQAEMELTERTAAAGGKPFGPGVSQATDLVMIVGEARSILETRLGQFARANGLTMPNLRGKQ